MKSKLDNLNGQISALEFARKQLMSTLDDAYGERKALIEASHTWSAADYRIVLIQDEGSFEFETIICEPPNDDDSEAFKARYQALHDAYHDENGPGIFAAIVALAKRDIETGDFESMNTCGGLFYLDTDSRDYIFSEARAIASDCAITLPDNVVFADIQVIAEGGI